LDVPWREYLRHGVAPAITPALSFLAAVELCKRFLPIQNYGGLVLAAILGLLAFGVCLWFFGLDDSDREMLLLRSRAFTARA